MKNQKSSKLLCLLITKKNQKKNSLKILIQNFLILRKNPIKNNIIKLFVKNYMEQYLISFCLFYYIIKNFVLK